MLRGKKAYRLIVKKRKMNMQIFMIVLIFFYFRPIRPS